MYKNYRAICQIVVVPRRTDSPACFRWTKKVHSIRYRVSLGAATQDPGAAVIRESAPDSILSLEIPRIPAITAADNNRARRPEFNSTLSSLHA